MVGTGVPHTVRDLAEAAFRCVGLNWQDHVVSDTARYRPADVMALRADAARARKELGWHPTVGFEELVAMMVEADLQVLSGSGPG